MLTVAWKPRKARGRLALGLVTAGLLAWLVVGAIAAWALSQRPRPLFEERPPFPDARAVRLDTSDGESLGAWFVPPSAGRPVVVLLHGIGDSRASFAGLMRSFQAQGVGSLAVSQRAHGDSSGQTCDVGWRGRNDVVAAVTFLEQHAEGHPIVVFGVSMGAAAATFAARMLEHRVAGYILEAPYADLDTAVRIRVEERAPWPLSWMALTALRLWAPAFVGERLSTISPAKHLRDIPQDVPVLVLAGGADHLAPLTDIQSMVRNAGSHVRLAVFPKAGHVQLARWYPTEFNAEVSSFVKALTKP